MPASCFCCRLADAEYGGQRMELLKEKAALEEMLRDTGHRAEQWVMLSEQTFEFACTVRERFAQGDAMTKKELLTLFASNLTLKDKKLLIEAKEPFLILGLSARGSKTGTGCIGPEKNGSVQGPKDPSATSGLCLCASRDDVRTYRGPKCRKMVRTIYHYFRKECSATTFDVSRWNSLSHGDRIAKLEERPRGRELPLEANQTPQ